MLDKHYTENRLTKLYDLRNKWDKDTDFYLSLTQGKEKLNILDIGCGTGLLALAFAEQGHRVTGVDPAESMLEVAKSKDVNNKVKWVQGTGQDFGLEEKYDLAVITGHAFQHLITDEDIEIVLRKIFNHLKIDGMIAFESRNPLVDWVGKWSNTPDNIIELGDEQIRVVTDSVIKEKENIKFSHHHHFSDETITSNSNLRFASCEKIKSILEKVGFRIKNLYGFWDKSEYTKDSLEMIFIARK